MNNLNSIAERLEAHMDQIVAESTARVIGEATSDRVYSTEELFQVARFAAGVAQLTFACGTDIELAVDLVQRGLNRKNRS